MNGEQLPLFILANWRGFSGGMRDMYDEVSWPAKLDLMRLVPRP